MSSPLIVRWRGTEAYPDCFASMRAFTEARTSTTPDEVWLVEHPPTYTLGLAGNPAHLLKPDSAIPLIKTDRGGQITYHGPGQVVAYLLLDLQRRKLTVRTLVYRIEQAVIDMLASYNLHGLRRTGAPGIYLSENQKIAALGLKIRHGCSYHGVSLNVDMDLRPFEHINPCGYAGLSTIDLAGAGVSISWREAAERLVQQLAVQFDLSANSLFRAQQVS